MILEKDFREVDLEKVGESSETIHMSVDAENINHLMMILSSNLYQDPIGSIIREYTSNAIDANVEAGVEEPVIVSLKNENNACVFSVEDYGVGIDDQAFKSIISKYGKSTKQGKNNQLGYYGLGCKSGFAYTSQFYYTSVKDRVERKYLLYKSSTNAGGFNIDLIFESPTDKRNGVKVTIPVKNGDQAKFVDAISKQLCYFDNVYFDLDYKLLDKNMNEMKITRFNNFQISSCSPYNNLHICLGKVVYPIDWSILGITSRVDINAGLIFDLDSGLFPTPSRESLIWNESTKTLVLERIKDFVTFLCENYNKSIIQAENITDVWYHIDNYAKNITLNGRIYDISSYKGLSRIPIQDITVKNISLNTLHFYKIKYEELIREYKVVGALDSNGSVRSKTLYYASSKLCYLKNKVALLSDHAIIKGTVRNYLVDKGYTVFIKKRYLNDIKEENLKYFKQVLNLDRIKKSEWRNLIKEFLEVRKSIVSTWTDLTDLEKSDDFLEFKRINKKIYKSRSKYLGINKQQGEIVITGVKKNRYNRYITNKFKCDLSKIQFLRKILVKVDENSDAFKYQPIFAKQNVIFGKISNTDTKSLQKSKFKNFMTLKEFEKTKTFKRIGTTIFAERICKLYSDLSLTDLKFTSSYLNKIFGLYYEVKKYVDKNYESASGIDSTIEDAIIQVCKTNNLWDEQIIHQVKLLEKLINDYSFITNIKNPRSSEGLIANILLMNKIKYPEKYPNLTVCDKDLVISQ